MRITITIDLPGVPEGAVSQPVVDITTRPDAAPCSCRGACRLPDGEPSDWFGKQEAAARLKRRRGTVLEGHDGA